ncbi:hypothetical protein FQN57_006508 [Myotisia sp. PD_48]|nr:hypothetical protein FQN57_006508 [Myotisia sp. PD_48]
MLGDFPLRDKVVLVTGGGSGIGLSFVEKALALHAKILIADLKLTTQAESLVHANPDRIAFTTCDVSKWNQLQDSINASKAKFGDIPDVYVASAGVFDPPWSNFWSDPEDHDYAVLQINVAHPIKLTRMAIRALKARQKKGVVLVVASLAGLQGAYAVPLYVASKHAVVGFTKSMAPAEIHEGVKVVAMCPGTVDTPLWTESKEKQEIFQFEKSKKLTAEEIADSMVELVEKGDYAGGTIFAQDVGVKWVEVDGKVNQNPKLTNKEQFTWVKSVESKGKALL